MTRARACGARITSWNALALAALVVAFLWPAAVESASFALSFSCVTAIVLFIILGAVHIFGLGVPATGFHNLYALPGGFFPHGAHGVWMAVILGLLSFVGIEVVAVIESPQTIRMSNVVGHIVLNGENVGELAVEPFRPNVRRRRGLDQLSGDPNPGA